MAMESIGKPPDGARQTKRWKTFRWERVAAREAGKSPKYLLLRYRHAVDLEFNFFSRLTRE
jgi:hypothetical protein